MCNDTEKEKPQTFPKTDNAIYPEEEGLTEKSKEPHKAAKPIGPTDLLPLE
jgi:hypothetical protein